MPLDSIDLAILAELQRDGSQTNVALAQRVHLSPSPCLARVRALERAGTIRRYVALVDPEAVGLGVSVFISISLREQNTATLGEFERRIADYAEVMEAYLMTGDADYLLRVVVPDIRALERFILERLSSIPGVEKIRSSFTLKQVRYETALPLRQAPGPQVPRGAPPEPTAPARRGAAARPARSAKPGGGAGRRGPGPRAR
jgi:Lrp/AsnC family leucine-responsive transcriptional regulator